MHANASVAIDLAQLLQLRHMPAPPWQQTPDANGAWLGAFRGQRRGHGTDYDDLRAYSPGDDVRHIDWRASARTHELQTRLYREEKEHRTSVICDFRPCMFTGSQQLRANTAATLCARLLWLACHGGSRITLIILTSKGFSMIAPGTGHATAINACVLLSQEHASIVQALQTETTERQTTLTTLNDTNKQWNKAPNSTSTNGAALWTRTQSLPLTNVAQGPTLESLLQWLVSHNEHRSTLLWVTGLDFEGERFTSTLSELKNPSISVVTHINDPLLNTALPSGQYRYKAHADATKKSDWTQRHAVIDKTSAQQLKQRVQQWQHERTQRFDTHKIALLSTANGDDNVIAALRQQGHLP